MGVDWEKMEREYVTGNICYRELIDKYGLPRTTLGRQGKKNGWVAKREVWRSRVNEKAQARCGERAAQRESQRLGRLMEASEKLDELLNRICDALIDPDAETAVRGVVSLASALKTAVDVKRDLYESMPIGNRRRLDLAQQKLELEKRRTEGAGKEKDAVIRVEMEEGLEEMAE